PQRGRRADHTTRRLPDQSGEALAGGKAVRVDEVSGLDTQGEDARTGQGGLGLRVRLRRLQPDPHTQVTAADRLRRRSRPQSAPRAPSRGPAIHVATTRKRRKPAASLPACRARTLLQQAPNSYAGRTSPEITVRTSPSGVRT